MIINFVDMNDKPLLMVNDLSKIPMIGTWVQLPNDKISYEVINVLYKVTDNIENIKIYLYPKNRLKKISLYNIDAEQRISGDSKPPVIVDSYTKKTKWLVIGFCIFFVAYIFFITIFIFKNYYHNNDSASNVPQLSTSAGNK